MALPPAPLAVAPETQPQGIVVSDERLQRLLQQLGHQRLRRLQHHRLIPVMRVVELLLEEPMLNRRQWRFTDGGALGLRGPGAAGDLRLRRHGRMLEQLARGQLQTGTPGASDDLDAEDGVAADLEEVVLDTDALEAEHVAPDGGQERLVGRARRQVGARGRGVGRRQRLAIDLAVRRQRQRVERDERRRHHVLGQLRRQGDAQLRHRRHRAAGEVKIRDQALLSGHVLARHHHARADSRHSEQRRLDLAELDPQAADLHLVIDSSEVLQRPVAAPARQVPRPIHARARLAAERIGHEPFGCQRGPIVVPAPHLHAAEVQLACRSRRHQVQRLVEHVRRRIRDRPANRHHSAVVAAHAGPRRDVDRGLRRAVEIVELAGQPLVEARDQLRRQRLAAAHHPAQARALLHARLFDEGAQHRRHEVHRRHAARHHFALEVARVFVSVRRRHHQARAGHHRPEQLPDRDVEAERGLLQHHVRGGQPVRLLHPPQAVHHATVCVACAFGLPRRARGVDDVRQIRRRHSRDRRRRRILRQRRSLELLLVEQHRESARPRS